MFLHTPNHLYARLALLLALMGMLAACSSSGQGKNPLLKELPIVSPTELGPLSVGFASRTVSTLDDISEYRSAEIDIWYPAKAHPKAGRDVFDGLHGIARRDASVLDGYKAFPLVIFSHGLAGIREQNNFQLQWLASRGYVVITADHHPSTLWDMIGSELGNEPRAPKVIESALARPLEMLHLIDLAKQWSDNPLDPMHRKINSDVVVVMGHSFGGYSALSVAGINGSFSALEEFCDLNEAHADSLNCSFVDDYMGEDIERRYVDPRIKGAFALTPGATPLAWGGGFADVTIPVFMWGGGLDDLIEPDLQLDWVFEQLPKPAIYATIPNAGHLDFSMLCLSGIDLKCGDYSGNQMQPIDILRSLNEFAAAFVDWTTGRVPDMPELLTEKAADSRWPLLDYRTKF